MSEQNKAIIEQTLSELLTKMGVDAKIEVVTEQAEDEENFTCNINISDDSNLLIGQHGINLQALQHIARLLVRKKTSDHLKFVLDINSYRQQKNQSVIEMAKLAASQAISEKRAVVMKPMSTYERRIVHMELAKNTDVTTESIGEGEGRKIIIKPNSVI